MLRLASALLGALVLTTITAAQGNAHSTPHARAARTLNVTDAAHLHYVRESGSMFIDEGPATGALPGTVKVQFNVGATVRADYTIYTHNGSLIGTGTGSLSQKKPQPGHTNIYASFSGTITVTHGTGRYAHARGTGGFYGVINRKTYAVTIQTTGTLTY